MKQPGLTAPISQPPIGKMPLEGQESQKINTTQATVDACQMVARQGNRFWLRFESTNVTTPGEPHSFGLQLRGDVRGADVDGRSTFVTSTVCPLPKQPRPDRGHYRRDGLPFEVGPWLAVLQRHRRYATGVYRLMARLFPASHVRVKPSTYFGSPHPYLDPIKYCVGTPPLRSAQWHSEAA